MSHFSPGHEISVILYLVLHFSEVWKCGKVWSRNLCHSLLSSTLLRGVEVHDQFLTRSIWRSLKQSQKFSDLRAFVQASNSQAYNPLPFQRFHGNSLQASQLQSTQASTVRGLLLSELNAVFAAKHFIFFISPILLKLEKEENDPMIGRRRVMFSGIWPTLVEKSKQRQLTPTSNY